MNDHIDMNPVCNLKAVCSECGLNVRQLQRTHIPSWSRAWIVPKFLTIAAILTVLILSLPNVQTAMGNPWAIRNSSMPARALYADALTPVIQLDNVQGLLDGDSVLRDQIVEHFDTSMDIEGPYLWEAQFRFVAMHASGEEIEFSIYGLVAHTYSASHLLDVRDEDSWDHSHVNGGETGFRFSLYGVHYQEIGHDSTYQRTTRVRYLDLLAVLVSAWLVVRVFGGVSSRVGGRVLRKRSSIIVATLLLSTLYVLLMLLMPFHYKAISVHSDPIRTSPWIDAQLFSENIDSMRTDSELGEHFHDSFVELLEAGQGQDLLLGIQTDRGHETHSTNWWMRVGPLELWSGQASSMSKAQEDGTEVVIQYPEFVGRGLDLDLRARTSSTLSWKSDDRIVQLRFEPMRVVMLGVASWMLWKSLHWIVRALRRRIDRRRINRHECVGCAYPITEKGRSARQC